MGLKARIAGDRGQALAAALLLSLAGLVTYANSFRGVFLFDDREHILGLRRLRVLWPLGEALARHRPVVDYSLAVNYAVHGEEPWGYHLVNLVVHVLAGITLFGIVRRTLGTPLLSARFAANSTWLAFLSAAIWIVHPLQTQSVSYVIQRAESMMGLFYLLTLYCVLRGAESFRGIRWFTAAVIASALGMGSKAVMVTAPVVILVYDRTFLAGSFREALRRRWGLYLSLACSWFCLWRTARGVLAPTNPGAHVGFGFKGVVPFDYLLTEAWVLLEYLKLSFWPHPLCLDYHWPVTRDLASALPAIAATGTLMAVAVWAVLRRSPVGFAATWFFLILAPTSSFIPIRDPMFEHRMYLSLAAVIVPVVLAANWLGQRLVWVREMARSRQSAIAVVGYALIGAALGMTTVRRNATYHDEVTMWRETLTLRPENPRAAENYGNALLGTGAVRNALEVLQAAVKLSPRSATLRNALGFALAAQKDLEQAIPEFREAIRLDLAFARAWMNLGLALAGTGKLDEALVCYRTVLQLDPRHSDAQLEVGNYYFGKKQLASAENEYRQLVQHDPGHASGWGNLGTTLLQMGKLEQAVEALQRARELDPKNVNVPNSLGVAHMLLKQPDQAIKVWRDILWLNPNSPDVHYNLAQAFWEKKDYQSAASHLTKAIEARPREPRYRYEISQILMEMGKIQDAVRQLEPVLELDPNYPGAQRLMLELKAKLEADKDGTSQTGP